MHGSGSRIEPFMTPLRITEKAGGKRNAKKRVILRAKQRFEMVRTDVFCCFPRVCVRVCVHVCMCIGMSVCCARYN